MYAPNTEVIPVNGSVAFMLFCVPLKVEQVLVVIQLEKKIDLEVLGELEFLGTR